MTVALRTSALDRRDLRRKGRWGPLQRLKNAVIYQVIRLALELLDRAPASLLRNLGRYLGQLAHGVLWRGRALARQNLAQSLPELEPRRAARETFRQAGENLARILLLRRPDFRVLDHVHIPEEARTMLEQALAEGRGAVFVSAHLGPFEWLPAAIAELGFEPSVVVRESYDPRLDPIVDAHRVARGIEVIHRGHPGAAMRIVRALRAGRLVGFLPDLGGRVPSVRARFLSRTTPLAVGPQRIARRAFAPLFVGTLAPTGALDGFELQLQRIEIADELVMTQSVANCLGDAIEASPEHWLWMSPRFEIQPD